MIKKRYIIAAALNVLLVIGSVQSAELGNKDLKMTVDKTGCGFIDSIQYKGRSVVAAEKGFVGGELTLVKVGDGTIESLFPCTMAEKLKPVIEEIKSENGVMSVSGVYTDGALKIPFSREITLAEEGNALVVKEVADFAALPEKYLLGDYRIKLPLVVTKNKHHRMYGLGGAKRAELMRMDMNDVRRKTQNLSDNRAFWPVWDIVGLRQLPGSYQIWIANHADTMAYPIEEGKKSQGWIDYSEPAWGITAIIEDSEKTAPWGMSINGRKGVMMLSPRPSDTIPVSGKNYGKHTFAFRLVFHDTSWPATYPCEMPTEQYKEFLKFFLPINPHKIGAMLGTTDINHIVSLERIQPSIVLRSFYRGDAWQMKGLLKKLDIKMDVPRNQSLDKWEIVAKEIFKAIKKNGVPAITPVEKKK